MKFDARRYSVEFRLRIAGTGLFLLEKYCRNSWLVFSAASNDQYDRFLPDNWSAQEGMKKSIGDNMIRKSCSFEPGLELVKKAGYEGIEPWLGEIRWFQINSWTEDGPNKKLSR